MARSNFQALWIHKLKIEKQYSCFKCVMHNHGQRMVCNVTLQPVDYVDLYKVSLVFDGKGVPKVFIRSPKIPYNKDIHMYRNGNLCLFYPPDFKWQESTSVAETIIPWINEWIVYYELYKISGFWEGPAAPHGISESEQRL